MENRSGAGVSQPRSLLQLRLALCVLNYLSQDANQCGIQCGIGPSVIHSCDLPPRTPRAATTASHWPAVKVSLLLACTLETPTKKVRSAQ